MTNFIEADHPRQTDGKFTDKPQSAPEVALQEPAPWKNNWETAWDARDEHGFPDRPMRTALPLTAGDDDEFFDSPVGSVLAVKQPEPPLEKGEYRQPLPYLTYTRRDEESWVGPDGEISNGELWASLFTPEGMRSSELRLPAGWVHSDQNYFTQVPERRVTIAAVREVLAGAKGLRMVEFGQTDDEGNNAGTAIPDGDAGAATLNAEVTEYGTLRVECGPKQHRDFSPRDYTFHIRGDQLIVRGKTNNGYLAYTGVTK